MNDACALTGHDFQPCGNDEQQCDAACRWNEHKCATCGQTRAQLEKEQMSVKPDHLQPPDVICLPPKAEVSKMEVELSVAKTSVLPFHTHPADQAIAEVLSTDPPATGL